MPASVEASIGTPAARSAANTARMRRNRAAGRLAALVRKLKAGQLSELLDD